MTDKVAKVTSGPMVHGKWNYVVEVWWNYKTMPASIRNRRRHLQKHLTGLMNGRDYDYWYDNILDRHVIHFVSETDAAILILGISP